MFSIAYSRSMYEMNLCQCPGCNKVALSNFNEKGDIICTPGYCLEHTPHLEEKIREIKHHVEVHDKVIGLCAPNIVIENIDLSNKKFYGCNLQNSTMTNVHANGLRARMCMLDFCTITDCDLLNSNIQFSSAAGAKLVHVLLTGSDLIHDNFNGITAYQFSFDDSDLYNSRFIKAMLINTSMKNCNLKKTAFYESVREGVSFKMSNTREALVDRRKGGLMGDLDAQFGDEENEELSL